MLHSYPVPFDQIGPLHVMSMAAEAVDRYVAGKVDEAPEDRRPSVRRGFSVHRAAHIAAAADEIAKAVLEQIAGPLGLDGQYQAIAEAAADRALANATAGLAEKGRAAAVAEHQARRDECVATIAEQLKSRPIAALTLLRNRDHD